MIYIAHLLGLLLTVVASGGAAWWVRRWTDDRAGTVLIVLLAVHVLMALCAAAVLSSAVPTPLRVASTHLIYAFVVAAPTLWLVFTAFYTGRESGLTGPVWTALAAAAVLPAALVLTNPVHDLLLVDFRVVTEPIRYPVYHRSGLMDALIVVTNLQLLAGLGLLFRSLPFSRRGVLWQLLALVVGMAAIVVTALLGITGAAPLPGFTYGVYGAGLFGVLVAAALFRTGVFAVAPLARDVLFDSIDDAIVVVDADGRIVDFNETAAERFPRLANRAGDGIGEVYPSFLAGTDGGLAHDDPDPLPDGVENRSPFAGTITRRTDGGRQTLRVTAHEVASGGEPRGYGLIVRDVSELEAYASDLERKTDQLERFASVLSHDLRNPVSVATGYVELAQETGDPEHHREALDALERIDETIGDLLTLSREGESIDDPETVALRSVVADAWSTSDTGDGVLENAVEGDVYVRADPSRLRTLLENLFRNAVEHGGETVRVGRLDDGFFVADDGNGIPEGERKAVFEHGYSTRPDGTGFGLAIVRSIATAHGWSIAVTEGRDGGARFEITGVAPDASDEPEPTVGSTRDASADGSAG
ncbi:histidine kinase N-terminal 7TM domain-containing protein [Halostella litorea]|uniref:histidine kinase N-terminal 7TM domain-containing protein n=1 Tax=Halostella litorea TaxID=2528831 RepID=UPI001091ECC4|nr:histidine kinase N-terminal 7TM domain-containing protein [Halostella litorea]